jgi:hypothetical protein
MGLKGDIERFTESKRLRVVEGEDEGSVNSKHVEALKGEARPGEAVE